MVKPVVIDVATHNTVVAYLDENDREQHFTVPSVLDLSGAPKLGVHTDAGPQILKRPKRVLGLSYTQASTSKLLDELQYQGVKNCDDTIKLTVGEKEVSIEECLAIFVKLVVNEVGKKCALYQQCHQVVMTHPANFPLPCISALKRVADYAGLRVSSVVSEAVAASFFGLTLSPAAPDKYSNKFIFNVDIGGGTTDITILKSGLSYGEISEIDVLVTCGDLRLGGNDVDNDVMQLMQQKAEPGFTEWIQRDGHLAEAQVAAEMLKRELSEKDTSTVRLGDFDIALTREDLDRCPSFARFKQVVDDVFRRKVEGHDISPADITNLNCAGGMSRSPTIMSIILDKLPQFKEPVREQDVTKTHPESAVALGALLMLKNDESLDAHVMFKDSTASDYGIELKRRGGIGTFIKMAVRSGKELPAIDEVIMAYIPKNPSDVFRVSLWEGSNLLEDDSVRSPNNHFMGKVNIKNDNFRYKSGEPITIKLSIDHDRKVAVSVDLPDGVNETGAFHEWGRPSEEVIAASKANVADILATAAVLEFPDNLLNPEGPDLAADAAPDTQSIADVVDAQIAGEGADGAGEELPGQLEVDPTQVQQQQPVESDDDLSATQQAGKGKKKAGSNNKRQRRK